MNLQDIFLNENGTPGPIRTVDLLLRRQLLYPAELRARGLFLKNIVVRMKGFGAFVPATDFVLGSR